MTYRRSGRCNLVRSGKGTKPGWPPSRSGERGGRSAPPVGWSRQALEEGHAAGLHPLDDKDVAVLVEAGVVRVDELARPPLPLVQADLELLHLGGPGRVVAEVD